MNKSFVTNLIAAVIACAGYYTASMLLMSIGLFALSGAITNWIAVHMLFEKVPGFYGSGVIPARFEEFKAGIRALMMEQFFTAENIQRFLSPAGDAAQPLDLEAVIDATDLSPAFDGLVNVIEESSFGNMLAMVGGSAALQPLQGPFTARLKMSLKEVSTTDEFKQMLWQAVAHAGDDPDIRKKIALVIEQRLEELTPQLVKEIVQSMIKKHLGWLVVWGGFLGGLIGLIAGHISPLLV